LLPSFLPRKHSLGAGTCSIAGIEWNDRDDIDVKVFGFGCPALLSEDLCKASEPFIVTVVDDADCVPRMSLATMVNGLMDIAELDWTEFALKDFNETVDEMERFLPSLVNESVKKDLLTKFMSMLPDPSSFNKAEKKRMTPVLFPPGKVIHFYRDGYGVTGSVVPSTFFDELEITRRMLDDHFFTEGYEQIFLSLMRQYHGDNLFSFEKEE
jgi:Lipase (class 3)